MPVLPTLLHTLEEHPGLPVVVFDLDSTLFDTASRHLRILHEVAAETGDPRLLELVGTLGTADMGWDVEHALRARGYDDKARLAELHETWKHRFFDGAWCRYDLPTAGAVRFVREVHARGAFVVYLSARPAPTMGAGTWEALARWRFPVQVERTMVHLKPDLVTTDAVFKAAATQALARIGDGVVATFDNEPAHVNRFAAAFPEALNVHLDTVHSPDAPPLAPGVVSIRNFLDAGPLSRREAARR